MKLVIKKGVLKKIKGAKDISNIEIPEGVTQIDPKAFKDCVNLKKVTFPGSVKVIDKDLVDAIYYGGAEIESIELKEGIEQISDNAFAKILQIYPMLKAVCIQATTTLRVISTIPIMTSLSTGVNTSAQ